MDTDRLDQLASLPVETIPSCLLCPESRGEEDVRFAGLLALPSPFGVLRCPGCGLRWLSPRPTQLAYERVYSDEFYFGGGGTAVDAYTDLARSRRPYFRDRLARIEGMLGLNRPLQVLEIGAATGEFLDEARSRGHTASGVEFSADARRKALEQYGLTLLSPDQSGSVGINSVDVIHMNHVLEHMPDPMRHIAWCRERLRPGGLMVIEVPQQLDNDLDRLKRALGLGGRHVAFDAYSLHHTYFFTPITAQAMFQRAGFTVLALATANPMRTPLWPVSLLNWVLRPTLWLSDRVHHGGNIIEIYASNRSGD